ncbi:hypothetical protein [Nostoc sp. 2RC]|uniref:hypothetical protein n=1 Tax=Nostoc sp. 2RC TaxID=2485484 RepID=UPI00162837E9|nr:hypothetical protein [Nostoc sp. 2RC]MBC1238462.1 hypothetical protein [Nostoc sp. 2RC]
MNKINVENFITKENLVELDDKTAAMVYGGSSYSFDESLARLNNAFNEAISRGIQLEVLKIQKGQEFKAANTSIDQK